MTNKSPLIIGIVNQKGGVGKTTISVNLGMSFKKSGQKIALVDADPQQSLRDWNEANDADIIPVFGFDRETIANDIKNIKDYYNVIIIDATSRIYDDKKRLNKVIASILRISDKLIIPVQPSALDVWSTSDIVRIIKEMQLINAGLPKASFLINGIMPNTKLSHDIYEAIDKYELPYFEEALQALQVYRRTIEEGLSIFHKKGFEKEMDKLFKIADGLLIKNGAE
jgi:chromosome partitioning protein